MRSAIVLIAVFAVCLGSPRRPVPRHPNAELIDGALQRIGDSRIINGDDVVDMKNFPWQASLKLGGSHSCGASIISDQWLVSAAHCTQYAARWYTVGAGSEKLSGQETRAVAQIINHEDYGKGSGNYPNDISLIRLSSPLTFGETIGKIDLADYTVDDPYVPCTISGWGVTTTGGGAISQTLKKADTNIMLKSTCEEKWSGGINAGHVCVGGTENEGACNGDSGGPLVCTLKEGLRLVGATSWGLNGCHTTHPSVYTNIGHFREWIRGKTGI